MTKYKGVQVNEAHFPCRQTSSLVFVFQNDSFIMKTVAQDAGEMLKKNYDKNSANHLQLIVYEIV